MKPVIAAVLLAAMASVGAVNVVHAADTAAIKELRWGVDGGYPPFDELSPAGTIVGFDPDIASAICVDMKVKCVFVVQPFESAIPALNQNKFDALIASLGITAEREKQVTFSDKYYSSGAHLVARKGSNLLPDVKSLAGKTVAVQSGSIHEHFAKENWATHGVKIVTYANQDNVYFDLLSGRVDAALQDDIQARASFLDTPRGKNFQFVGQALETSDSRVAIAVQKGNLKLRDAINKSIANIRANGKYDAIRKKYFSFDIYGS